MSCRTFMTSESQSKDKATDSESKRLPGRLSRGVLHQHHPLLTA
jgi:hypothetical protein